MKDYAAPIYTRRLRWQHIGRRLFYLAVAALTAHSIFTLVTGAA